MTGKLVELRRRNPIPNLFLERVKSDRFGREDLRALIRGEIRTAEAEMTVYALGTALHRHEVFQDLNTMAVDARSHLSSIRPLVGIDDESAENGAVGPDGFACPGFLSWAVLHCNRAELGLVMYADLESYGGGSREIADAMQVASTEVPEQIVRYYADGVPDGLSSKVLGLVQEGIDRGDDVSRAVRLARVMEECVGRYWQAAVAPERNAPERNAPEGNASEGDPR
ncbi:MULTISPECIES: hypothetical protein [Actinomadura]|uniref:Uncharacterized protein n=1 Tax=Actinomadura yumaensis TaxID=111807 RepID=A0ABW2CLS7_9ACTN|nr:hypothetical protein [Actinomadura sp. J1-007]MWK36921.1 hypothetical protein [Actinomadura sp. J1-007]